MTLAYRFAIHRFIQQLPLKDLRKRHGKHTQHLTQQRVGIIKERVADHSHQHGDCGAGEHLAETAINTYLGVSKTGAPRNLQGLIGISWNFVVLITGYPWGFFSEAPPFRHSKHCYK